LLVINNLFELPSDEPKPPTEDADEKITRTIFNAETQITKGFNKKSFIDSSNVLEFWSKHGRNAGDIKLIKRKVKI
jgi:hypothetical protein